MRVRHFTHFYETPLKLRASLIRLFIPLPTWHFQHAVNSYLAREYFAIGPEMEYFWYQNRRAWELHHLPDPRDEDPVRYAILACIAEEPADAFNWRLSLRMRRDKKKHIFRETLDEELPPFTPETVPTWTKSVPAFDGGLIADCPDDMLSSPGRLVLEAGGENKTFAKRNIVTDTGKFYTV